MIARFLRYDGEYECHQVEPEWVSDIISSVKGQYFIARQEFSINGADYKHVDIIYENDSEEIDNYLYLTYGDLTFTTNITLDKDAWNHITVSFESEDDSHISIVTNKGSAIIPISSLYFEKQECI